MKEQAYEDRKPLSLRSKLLLASPVIGGGIFHKSVVFISKHDMRKGAFGFVLNKVSGKKIGEVFADVKNTALRQMPIFVGGPVNQDEIIFACFYNDSNDNTLRIKTHISKERAEELSRSSPMGVRAFVGMSQWSPLQLETELLNNSWIIRDAPIKQVLRISGGKDWTKQLEAMGAFYSLIAKMPDDPSVN